MKPSEKQTLLNIINEQKRDNRQAIFAVICFAVLALLLFIILIFTLDNSSQSKNQICVPKMSGFFQATDGTHAVAIFDTLNPNQQQLAGEVNQILNQINNIQGGAK